MSSKNSNKLNIPEAKAAMNKFKMEAASEVGVNLKQGYNGDLTSRIVLWIHVLPARNKTKPHKTLRKVR